VGFKSNGKPGRIYHWNLPVLSKIFGGNGRSNSKKYKEKKANLRHSSDANDIADLIDIQHIPTWLDASPSMWHENDTMDKSSMYSYSNNNSGSDDDERAKILKKKSTPSYYAPIKKSSNSNLHKYFPSNGKPKSFYVMKNNEKSFHNLID
jgi:hypothetical protein